MLIKRLNLLEKKMLDANLIYKCTFRMKKYSPFTMQTLKNHAKMRGIIS